MTIQPANAAGPVPSRLARRVPGIVAVVAVALISGALISGAPASANPCPNYWTLEWKESAKQWRCTLNSRLPATCASGFALKKDSKPPFRWACFKGSASKPPVFKQTPTCSAGLPATFDGATGTCIGGVNLTCPNGYFQTDAAIFNRTSNNSRGTLFGKANCFQMVPSEVPRCPSGRTYNTREYVDTCGPYTEYPTCPRSRYVSTHSGRDQCGTRVEASAP